MHKKLTAFSIAIALLAFPVIASAQTASTSSASVIATLESLVATLTSELQALIAAHGSSFQFTNPTALPTSSNSSCSTFNNLQKGETDATTGGEVSRLQAFLGINPTTGYYGAKTSIAYQNKCGNLGNSQPKSVPGMSQYTDSSFGFSFWYPSEWTVSGDSTSSLSDDNNPNAADVKSITVSDPNNSNVAISIDEMHISTGSIEVSEPDCITHFSYDTSVGNWMQDTSACDDGSQTTPYDQSNNTMGGLPDFVGQDNGLGSFVRYVPLSATSTQNVLLIYSGGNGENDPAPLANTIVSTNLARVTPVSTNEQIAAIQSEASTYMQSDQNNR